MAEAILMPRLSDTMTEGTLGALRQRDHGAELIRPARDPGIDASVSRQHQVTFVDGSAKRDRHGDRRRLG